MRRCNIYPVPTAGTTHNNPGFVILFIGQNTNKNGDIKSLFYYLYKVNLSTHDKLLIQQFFANKPVKKAYLFGSYARNTAVKSTSDIDILVELDHSKPIGLLFFTFQYELEDLLRRKVDLVSDEGLSRHVRPYVEKDKILIYDRTVD